MKYDYNNNYNFKNNNINKDENEVKMMNRSSSYFHPRKTFNTFFDLDNKKKNKEEENNIREIDYDFKNNNQYKNYIEQNKKFNFYIPKTITRTSALKSKFFNIYDNNDFA